MGVVEPQAVLGDQRAFLRHVFAQPVAQGRVKQVSGRMIGANTVAALGIDREMNSVANRDRAAVNTAVMGMQAA